MRSFVIAFVYTLLVTLPVLSQEPNTASPDLSELKARFQTILNEIDSDNSQHGYESSVTNLLSKVDNLQRSSDISQNISLGWFVNSREPTSAPWMSTPLRIVLVVSSFEGMYLNSGIGTFYAALSDFLVHQGHSVTILYTRADNSSEKTTFQRWKTSFEKRGVRVVRLQQSGVKITSSLLARRSYQVYNYLVENSNDFDAVHFPEWEGPGYYSTLAKHEGIAFQSKIFIVGLHGPWRWVKNGNFKAEKGMLSQADDFETDWLERKSVEYADMVWTPSADLVQWLSSQGWAFPSYEKKQLYLMPYLPGRELSRDIGKGKSSSNDDVTVSSSLTVAPTTTELVFFGRLEKRKGLELFADALDKLTIRRPEFMDIKITFLGRTTQIGSMSATAYLDQRRTQGRWSFDVNYVTHKDRKGALEYLRSDSGRVAIIPSLIENTPYTVYECLYLGVPFVASNLPSIAALVHPEDRSRVLSSLDGLALAIRLEAALDNGAAPVRSAFNLEKAGDSWVSFYKIVANQIKNLKVAAKHDDDFQPLVSVCITTFNRPELLKMALDSVNAQTYRNFEVVLVDDGSTQSAAVKYVDSLKPSFEGKGWKIVRTGNQYLGAARNTAAKLARGEFLLFLDDDNIAKPKQLSTYVSVAGKTGSDILTAAHDVFSGTSLPDERLESTNIMSRSVPIGPSAPLGIFKNCFGDANFFIKKSSFMQIGGFTEDKGVGQEDHEFLAKAVLGGHQLFAIPEVLLYYRMHNKTDQMISSTDPIKNHLRAKRPYADAGVASYTSTDKENLDLLKILAFENHRSSRDARALQATCNASLAFVEPSRIPALSSTTLTFTINNIDCTIEGINIGEHACSTPVRTSASHVTCESPAIVFPGDYAIQLIFREDSTYDANPSHLTLEVYDTASPDSVTRAIVSMTMRVDPNDFSESAFGNLLADIAGVSPNTVSVSSKSARKREFTDVRNLRIIVTSYSESDPASAVVIRLLQILKANPGLLSKFGELVDLSFSQTCGLDLDSCECTPNYSGDDCSAAGGSCPNDCSGQGTCMDGVYARVCQCNPGYTGRDCSTGACTESSCNNQGTCIIEEGEPISCHCNPGWSGVNCTVTTCPVGANNQTCSGRGTCADAGMCDCSVGFSGIACEEESGPENIAPKTTKKTSSGTIAFAVIVSIVGFAVIVVAGIAIYLYRKHKQNGQQLTL